MLFTLVYVSSATYPFSAGELAGLLQICRRKNARSGITGLLLHVGGNFMQALEGDEGRLDELFRIIAADRRHRMVKTIVRLPIEARHFPDWAMGFREAGSLPPEIRAQISSFLDDVGKPDYVAAPDDADHAALRLLRGFALAMR